MSSIYRKYFLAVLIHNFSSLLKYPFDSLMNKKITKSVEMISKAKMYHMTHFKDNSFIHVTLFF
mgnify:CR=1 FL=1